MSHEPKGISHADNQHVLRDHHFDVLRNQGETSPAHVHARYQGHKAAISIEDATLLAGDLPLKQLRMVQVWVDLHRDALLANWELVKEGGELFRIDPLK